MSLLEGKVLIVTGGSRGIGKAVSLEAAKKGAVVVVNYRKDQEAGEKVVESIVSTGGIACAIQADISDYEQVQMMVNEVVQRFGKIDVLINNAGISKDSLIFNMDPSDWKTVMHINFGGVFNCTKAVAETMMHQREGVIINVSSAMSEGGFTGQSNYAASKAAINAFTRTAAIEFARFNVRVNAVLPGYSETEMIGALMKDTKRFTKQIPQNRFSTPVEVANPILFLSSDEASHITGAMLTVDGGSTCTLGIGKPL